MAETLDSLFARGRRAWPAIGISAERFAAYVQERAGDDVAAVHAEDLFLACGCALGDRAAMTAFEATHRAHLRACVGRVDTPEAVRDEAYQSVLQDLLVAEPGQLPRIAGYSGRGPLAAFLRVVAVRETVRLARAAGGSSDDDLWEIPADQDDPELAYLKALYGGAFRSAFAEALSELSAHERGLLRCHLVEGQSIDGVAATHDVHRATAARWLARARAKLVTGTQRRLARRLRLSPTELESVLRLVESNVDLSARRLLLAG